MLEKLIALQLFMSTKRDEERGATATEYALLVAFIAFAIIVGATLFGDSVSGYFSELSGSVDGFDSDATS
jgi:pilus assembly protein Flp/PilA